VRRQPHELWHPTPQKFEFFFTVSYWVAISGVIATMLLTVKSVVLMFDLDPWHESLVKLIDTIGDMAFTVMVYLQYVELINMPEEKERHVWAFPAWGPIIRRLNWESVVGTLTFVFSMLLFDVGAVAQNFDLGTGVWAVLLLQVPAVVGGFGFALGGVCEVIHNRHKTPAKVAWWAAMLDCLGGFGYFMGGVACLSESPTAVLLCKVCYLGGISMYLVACVLLFVMWRANDFGLLLLRQLNHAIMSGGEVTLAPVGGGVRINLQSLAPSGNAQQPGGSSANRAHRFSVRGVVFLIIYCWLFTCCLMKCTAHILLLQRDFYNNLRDFAESALWLLIVSIVLLIHSSITTIPNQQPYRLGMILMRITLSMGALVQTSQLMKIVLDGQ